MADINFGSWKGSLNYVISFTSYFCLAGREIIKENNNIQCLSLLLAFM